MHNQKYFLESLSTKKVLIVSFGPVDSLTNGYFVRTQYLVDLLREKLITTKRLELVSVGVGTPKVDTANISRAHFFVTVPVVGRMSKILFSFDPFSVIAMQVQLPLMIFRNIKLYIKSDVIIVVGGLLPFALVLGRFFGKRVILDTHSINTDIALKIQEKKPFIGHLRRWFWSPLEYFLFHLCHQIIVVSKSDGELAKNIFGIDSEIFVVVENKTSLLNDDYDEKVKVIRKMLRLNNKYVVLFVGNLNAIQNSEAVDWILKKLAPDFTLDSRVRFVVVGSNPQRIKNTSNVLFTDFVDELAPYIAMADICIAPLSVGGGVKTKMLDYIVMNKKILATAVAMEGIDLSTSGEVEVLKLDDFPRVIALCVDRNFKA